MENGKWKIGNAAVPATKLARVESPRGSARYDIIKRTAVFCDRCLQAALSLKGNGVCFEIAKQLTRSSGGVGANVEEAQGSNTRDDFAYKMSLALKEARESRFWLRRVFNNRPIKPNRLAPLIQESEEIVAILTTIVTKSRTVNRARRA